MNRTDLHFHILPGIDDGPGDFSGALALAADAVADGTSFVTATPHIRPGHVTDVSELPARVASLQAALRREGIPLAVATGGEVAHGMVERLRQRDLETIAQGPAHGRWILLEAPFAGFCEHFHEAARELRERGFGTLVAHPERAAEADSRRTSIRREVLAGSAFQVNVWSLAGRHGAEARDVGLDLVRTGFAAVVASDAHPGWRRPLISEAVRDLRDAGVEEERIRRLVVSGPRRLVEVGLGGRRARTAAAG